MCRDAGSRCRGWRERGGDRSQKVTSGIRLRMSSVSPGCSPGPGGASEPGGQEGPRPAQGLQPQPSPTPARPVEGPAVNLGAAGWGAGWTGALPQLAASGEPQAAHWAPAPLRPFIPAENKGAARPRRWRSLSLRAICIFCLQAERHPLGQPEVRAAAPARGGAFGGASL